MLKPAIKYKDQLEKLQYDIWFVDKYKYWNCSTYYNTLEIAPDTWNKHQFVSVKDGIVLGYILIQISVKPITHDRPYAILYMLVICHYTYFIRQFDVKLIKNKM